MEAIIRLIKFDHDVELHQVKPNAAEWEVRGSRGEVHAVRDRTLVLCDAIRHTKSFSAPIDYNATAVSFKKYICVL